MITLAQLKPFAKLYNTNDSTVFREYLQFLFLNQLYTLSKTKQIIFKGGTAIHLIFKAPRFSEDLDFTVVMPENEFLKVLNKTFSTLTNEGPIGFKERETLTGKRFLLSATLPDSTLKSFINLDFSFREQVFEIEKSIVKPEYPILLTAEISHMSKNEIISEKIRAIMHRQKGRDIYDLWYLLANNAIIDSHLVDEKFKYHKEIYNQRELINRIEKFSKINFVSDLLPFIQFKERDKLNDLFTYIITFLKQNLQG
jgi:predicted nucleotidyltransferase component of viral defense system